ncbi:hypothetical protein CIZ59_20505 [Klebsiella pneumoniae]|nr:hypothetical protein [Klebsiella pneumoniae]
MSNVTISKKSIIDAAVVITDELQLKADQATQTYNEHYQNGTHTKADKAKEGANKQVISSQADSLIKISRIWADFFPANTSNQPI